MLEQVQSQNLDHLGIIAGIIDEIGIEEIVNECIGVDKREKVSGGKIVKAILLNGLGMLSKALYLFPDYFKNKAIGKLLGEGIQAEDINDDKIGRVMDKLREYGLEKLWRKIGLEVIKTYEIERKYSHLDSTSISVEGEYKKSEEGVVHLTYGYSKDKRPDLKQFMIHLIVSQDGDVPLGIKIGSGNESDQKIFGEIITAYQKEVEEPTTYIADSALYTAENLQKLGELEWLSRVPLTNKKAKKEVETLKEKELKASEQEGYRYKEKRVNHHGIEQRWQIIESEARKKSDLEKLNKKIQKEQDKIEKKLRNWQNKGQDSLEELQVEVKQFRRQLKYHKLDKIRYSQKQNTTGKIKHLCSGRLQIQEEVIDREKNKAGRFILATNILDSERLPAQEILSAYKAQQSCERGFRFLKDPLFLADSVYLKTPRRIETLGMLMGLCLLVYNLGQRKVRQELQLQQRTIRNNSGQPTSTPTLRWILQMFDGLHFMTLQGESFVSNLTDELREILKYFSVYCQRYYGLNV